MLMLLAVITVLGCDCGVRTHSISVSATPDTNFATPIRIDLVWVIDRDLVPTVSQLSASQWFEMRDQMLRDFTNGLEVESFELVVPFEGDLSLSPHGAEALFVFAADSSPGAHRARLDSLETVHLLFGPEGFTVYDGQ